VHRRIDSKSTAAGRCLLVRLCLCLLFLGVKNTSRAQAPTAKEINHNYQVWTSINNIFRYSEHWGMLLDFHVRTNNFLADPSFYFLRGAANYWIKENLTVALGYGHMWQAPTQPGWTTFSNENRIYQQFQITSRTGRSLFMQRVRNEQRWQQQIVDDKKTNQYRFTNRIRYLFGYTYTVFQNLYLPCLTVSDEILLQFGSAIIYNTFDQNRFFIGIRQSISPRLNFDFGYMNVFLQKSTGYQYDMNHTLRLFFYYSVGWGREKYKNFIEDGDE
jgi:hypothetical protein